MSFWSKFKPARSITQDIKTVSGFLAEKYHDTARNYDTKFRQPARKEILDYTGKSGKAVRFDDVGKFIGGGIESIFSRLKVPTRDLKTIGRAIKPPVKDFKTVSRVVPKIGEAFGEGVTSLAFGDIRKKGISGIPKHIFEIEKEIARIPGRISFQFGKTGARLAVGEKAEDTGDVLGFGKIESYNKRMEDKYIKSRQQGMSDKMASAVSILGVGGEFIFDATILSGFIRAGISSISKNVKVPLKSQTAAWEELGRPKTLKEAGKIKKDLQVIYHPDKPTGNLAKSTEINNAYSILEKSGIPKVPAKISVDFKKTVDVLEKKRKLSSFKFKDISREFKTAEQPYLGVKGLLPEQVGTLPTRPFQPARKPSFGLSVRDIEAKPIVKPTVPKAKPFKVTEIKSIHPEDQRKMVEFIDNVRLKKPQNVQLELDARRIAEHYDIKTPKTVSGLANNFDETLAETGRSYESFAGRGVDVVSETKADIITKPEKAKVVLKSEEKAVDISEDIYTANKEMKKSIKQVIKKDIGDAVSNIKLGTDKYLGSVSTRLKNINPELKRGLRTFEYTIRQKTLKDTLEVKSFLNSTKKMSKNDYLDFDLARKNGDKNKIESLIKKYNLEKEHNKLRKTLDDLYQRAEDVGYTVGYKESYHPRIIKDTKGFLNYFQRGDDWNIIGQSISAKENALGRYLNEEEKAQLINSMLRGYQQNNITLSEIGNMKARTINIVDAELNQFYMDSNSALLSYITKANEAIEARVFFGKGMKEGIEIEDSIGGYILKLMSEGKIRPDQEVIVSDILKARFKNQGTRGIVSTYKNLSYVDTMGSPISAITQIGDLSWALYKAGFTRTAKGIIKSATGKVAIKKESIGIERIAEEFADTTKSAKAVSKVFKLVGLEKIDAIGKETLIDAVISKYQSWAKVGNKRLTEKLMPVFGDNKKLLQEVVNDLKAKNNTENVKLLAFNELADMQPILLSEMPQKYLTGGNGRLFYMLKTFTLKQFDIYRNEIFQKIAHKGTRLEGLKNLVSLTAFFVLMNATADELKDLILNRKTSLKDRTVDNMLRAVGFSKYLTWKVREEGLGSGVARQILPPFKFIDSVSKDILKGIENGSEITQSIPLGGKLYYWWFGKGKYKTEKRKKKPEEIKSPYEKAIIADREKDKKIREEFKPKFDIIRKLSDDGKEKEAMKLLDKLTEDEYKIYRKMLTSEKTKETNKMKKIIYPMFLKIRELNDMGDKENALMLVNRLSDEEYKAYRLLLKQLD